MKNRVSDNSITARDLVTIPGINPDFKMHPRSGLWKKASKLAFKRVEGFHRPRGLTYRVKLNNGQNKAIYAAVLVVLAFHKAPYHPKLRVHFADGNPENISARNLSWSIPVDETVRKTPETLLTTTLTHPRTGEEVLMAYTYTKSGSLALIEIPCKLSEIMRAPDLSVDPLLTPDKKVMF